ncbi:MAG: hypothetical protein WBB28_01625 [Crinalium sp.]
MELTYDSDWDKLFNKLDKLEHNVARVGEETMSNAARHMNWHVRNNLATQGRGGEGPELSSMTLHIYEIDGQPDGSGIRNHLTLDFKQRGNRFTATLGIPEGKPTMVAKVQNDGAIIPVTEKMRSFLKSRYRIGLGEKTSHIIVPGRKFWDNALKETRHQVLLELRMFFSRVLI